MYENLCFHQTSAGGPLTAQYFVPAKGPSAAEGKPLYLDYRSWPTPFAGLAINLKVRRSGRDGRRRGSGGMPRLVSSFPVSSRRVASRRVSSRGGQAARSSGCSVGGRSEDGAYAWEAHPA
jgi:hypothetical protein